MRIRLLGLILTYAYASTLAAQTPLFLSVQQADSGGSLPPTANAYYDVEIDFAALKYAPDELLIALPSGDSVVALKREFLYRAGYAYRTKWIHPGPRQFTLFPALRLTPLVTDGSVATASMTWR